MAIRSGERVTIDYAVKVNGEIVEKPDTPVDYVHGVGLLLPALEARISSMAAGAHATFSIPPEEAYGVRDETNVLALPRSLFPPTVDIFVGARLAARTQSGETYPLTVIEAYADRVVVDLNHPLAGKTLIRVMAPIPEIPGAFIMPMPAEVQ